MTRVPRTLGVFGGSFDPIHTGHLHTVEAVRRRLGLDTVLIVPAAAAPHKPDGPEASAFHRFAMAALALQEFPDFLLSDFEVSRGGTSYSVDTLRHARESFPGSEVYLIVGSDTLLTLPTWRAYPEIVATTRMGVLFREPDDYQSVRAALPPELLERLAPEDAVPAEAAPGETIFWGGNAPDTISSTWLRKAIRAGANLSGKLPPSVETYLRREKLYPGPPPSGP